ncbi:carboxyl-terminal processing protease [Amphibacillus marinus]|uniref:C-terminal processing peptidase n=1 Tax=Amphibacillus marinus TaxID=872970 RepID=A0A1H8IPV1_9BACI|nr:S41 family peptidase [Amphibacillus marinus]SEN70125.1 carboxyl-terminal processing protease [Amphibacillus marinus]
MQIKKGILALLIIFSFAIGGFGTYAVISGLTNDLTEGGVEQGNQQLTEEEYEELLAGLSEQVDMPKIAQAFSLIQENYINEVTDTELIEGAVRGMLETLNDPYSEYMDQETMAQFNEQLESSFEGIGAEVSMIDGRVTIVAPIKDSPAEKAGLRPNDQVLAVDDETLDGLDLLEAVAKIRGEKGSEVTLEIQRPGVNNTLDFILTRDTIPLETVYAETAEHNGQLAGIIKLTSFSEQTANRFIEELDQLEEEGIDGLVIDVRGNPGGLLPVIEDILKHFVTSDQPYMQIADGNDNKERYFSNLDQPKPYPVTVLIDEGSASASEILAISLQETIGAEIVGQNSFGKGTVQSTLNMGDGSSIKLTILKWLSPEGNSIHEVGVAPTIEVAQPDYYYTAPIQLEETLVVDNSDDNIAFAQTMLKGLGYEIDREDGYFNEVTEQAVARFQIDQDLPETGELDQNTADLLQLQIVERIRANEDDLQEQAAIEALF